MVNRLTDSEKVEATVLCLDGVALKWHHYEEKRRPIATWEEEELPPQDTLIDFENQYHREDGKRAFDSLRRKTRLKFKILNILIQQEAAKVQEKNRRSCLYSLILHITAMKSS